VKPAPPLSGSAAAANSQKAPERKEGDVRESAPAADAASKPAVAAAKPANERVIAMPGRFAASGAQADAKGGAAEALANARASVFGLRPATGASLSEGEQKPVKPDAITPDAIEPASAPMKGGAAKSIPILTEAATQEALAEFIGPLPKPETKSEIKEPAEALQALKAAVAAPPSSEVIAVAQAVVPPPVAPVAAHVPSESLIDAVMNLVQEEPSALSVFTSGADFIHGIHSAHESGSHAVPEFGASAEQAAIPAGTKKLDASAAELLRPMLRQWLAENMGRILEEALRSELKSSQKAGAPPSDKA
jgi:cell pole-organizing protein PopZ